MLRARFSYYMQTAEQPIQLSIVVPIFNEEALIQPLYRRLVMAAAKCTPHYELIFVNDGSRDASFPQIKMLSADDQRVFYVNFSRNFGHQIAVSAGLEHARGEAVVIIDGDLQDPPELIPELYNEYKRGFEVVYAKRRKRKGESAFKKFTAKLFYRMLNRMTSFEIPLDTGDFRIIGRKVVDALNAMPEQNKFIRGQIAWLGFRESEVLYDRDKRDAGKTGYSISKMLNLALDGITSFSDKPLLFVTRMGFLMSFISFLVIIYALFSYFVLDVAITGWTSIIVSTMFIGGIQLISIGVIGAYISRINKNIIDRPLYIVKDTNCLNPKDD